MTGLIDSEDEATGIKTIISRTFGKRQQGPLPDCCKDYAATCRHSDFKDGGR